MNQHKLNLICYIAGPMTGLPSNNYPAFNTAEKALQEQGLRTLNPADNRGPAWADYMRQSLHQIAQANMMYMLLGWEKSKGAKIEHQLAKDLGLLVLYQQATGSEPMKEQAERIDPRAIQTKAQAEAEQAALKARYEQAAAKKKETDKLTHSVIGNGPDHPGCGTTIAASKFKVKVRDMYWEWRTLTGPLEEDQARILAAGLSVYISKERISVRVCD